MLVGVLLELEKMRMNFPALSFAATFMLAH
jgi:hypothetical protein